MAGCSESEPVNESSSIEKPTYTVILISKNQTYRTIEVEEGNVLGNIEITEIKSEITADGRVILTECKGWFIDRAYSIQWNPYSDPVQCDMKLYAKWGEIEN